MLHDIFKKITKKRKTKKLPIIIIDIHEKNSLVISELFDNVKFETKSLKIGDYLIGDIIIERKTVSDFISSMINRRLIQQLNQLKKYKYRTLIIEGDIQEKLNEDSNISSSIRGLILSIIINHQIPIIFSRDYKDTAKYLISLAKRQIKKRSEISFHSKIPKSFNEQKSYILESFPNIGPKKAKKLLEKFKTVKNTINATGEELKDILKSRTKNFIDILEKD